jgi:hypothetical protein
MEGVYKVQMTLKDQYILRLSLTSDGKMGETFTLLPPIPWMPLPCKIPHLQQQNRRDKIAHFSRVPSVKGGRGERARGRGSASALSMAA